MQQSPRKKIKIVEPTIGEEWTLNLIPDPWGGQSFGPVKILDVKDGWVKYYSGGAFPDVREKLEGFIKAFHKTKSAT